VAGVGMDGTYGDEDELMEQAKDIIMTAGRASTSLLQRRLSIGYGRAAKILDMLEESGFVGPSNGSKPREVLVSKDEYESNIGISAMPVHHRQESQAPGSYLGEDEGDDGTLQFTDSKETDNKAESVKEEKSLEEPEEEDEKKPEKKSLEKDVPDFLTDDDGPEDEIATEDEIIKNAKEDSEEDLKENSSKNSKDKKPHHLDDDDDDMFFAR